MKWALSDDGGAFLRPEGRRDRQTLHALARALAAQEDFKSPVINDCGRREEFAVVLLASGLCGQPCLLPGSPAPGVIADLQSRYPGARHLRALPPLVPAGGATTPLNLAEDTIAVIAFTSGSTGAPKPIAKTWRALRGTASRLQQAAGWTAKSPPHIVATVPAQHMYGLETSILSVLNGSCVVDNARPFFPADIAAHLSALPEPRVLVSTPLHLRAILKSAVRLPALNQIMSATSPLTAELASELEQRYGCQICEIYGSTETGAIASRAPTQATRWTLFPRVRFRADGHGLLDSDHLPAGAGLQDDIEILDKRHFTLLGRPGNMLKVGGKRYSVDALTAKLQSIAGVEDAVVVVPPGQDRPAALVVAPGLSPGAIREALKGQFDAVFLPRPLRMVAHIPRSDTGKTRSQDLLELLVT